MKLARAGFVEDGVARHEEATWEEIEQAVRARHETALQTAKGWQYMRLRLKIINELRQERASYRRNLYLEASNSRGQSE